MLHSRCSCFVVLELKVNVKFGDNIVFMRLSITYCVKLAALA